MPTEKIMYSENHLEDTAMKRLLQNVINNFTVSVRVIVSKAESSGVCTDNEETVRSLGSNL